MTYLPHGRPQASPFPGVTIERRALLGASALLAAGGLAAAGPAGRPRSPDGEAPFDFEAFAAACEALAEAHAERGRIDPDVYLHRLAALAKRLAASSVPRPALRDFGGFDPPVETAPVRMGSPVFVIQWRLAPGAVLPAHGHSPMHVVSLCLEGQCRVRHYEVVGDAPAPGAPGAFRIRRTLDKLLRPGLSSSLTPVRDNVHEFVAGPEGAFGVDVNTAVPGEGDWSMLRRERRASEGFDELYDATWTGKP